MVRGSLKSAEELRGTHIVLARLEDGWDLLALDTHRFNRRDYVTVIDLPEDIYSESLEDALIDLAGIISAKLTNASRAINATKTKSDEERSEIAKKAAAARWSDRK